VTSLDHPEARQADISEARASGRLRTSAELPAWRPLVEAARVPPPSDAPAPFAFSLSDFEDFRRTSVARLQEEELFEFVRTLAAEQRRFRMHVTDERAIDCALDVLERVDAEVTLKGLAWELDFCDGARFDHVERIAGLGGRLVSQHRLAWRGEPFIERFGLPGVKSSTGAMPPQRLVARAIHMVSCNPWLELRWLSTGRLYSDSVTRSRPNFMDRPTALWLYTTAAALTSADGLLKGKLDVGQHADFAVLSHDFLRIADADIPKIRSVLTVVAGQPVHAEDVFRGLLGRATTASTK